MNWNIAKLQYMTYMFYGAEAFNQPFGDNWNTASVKNMGYAFRNAKSFNQDIGNWNTANVEIMAYMFQGASAFNQNLSNWQTSNVTDMSHMFNEAINFNNGDEPGGSSNSLNNWNTSKVTRMHKMFRYASAFNQNLSNWQTSNVTDMSNMFNEAINFNNGEAPGESQNTMNWDTKSLTDTTYMFYKAGAFNQKIGSWDTSNVTGMMGMFMGASSFNQNLNNWDTRKVTSMMHMFNGATVFNNGAEPGDENKPINWNTIKVKYISYMFQDATSFNQPFGENWTTCEVIDMKGVFLNARKFNQYIGDWDTANVTNTAAMFQNARAFNNGAEPGDESKPLNWDTGKVRYMNVMFNHAYQFNQPFGPNWNTSTVINMLRMFSVARSFNQDISNWNVASVGVFDGFLSESNMQYYNYDKLLNAWSGQTVKPNLTLDAVGVYYCNAQPARDVLTNAPNNWTINDAGQACPPSNITLSNTGVDEGTTYVGQFTGDDPNGPLIFTLVAGAGDDDNTQFTISNSGVLAFFTAPDFENPTGHGGNSGNNYTIRIQAKNTKNLTTQEVFIITVIDVDDFSPEITITAPTKTSTGVITDTVIEVSDRFSIASISLAGSTTATEDFVCNPTLPYINPTPFAGQHGVVTCNVKIMSSGKLVVTAQDLSGNIDSAFEDGYRIDAQGPQLTTFYVDTESPYSINNPQVHFDALDSGTVAKYELVYKMNDGITGSIPDERTTSTYTTGGSVVLNLDPDEAQHTITIYAYDGLGNKTNRHIVFPPIVIFDVPTMVSSGIINDTKVRIINPTSGETLGEIEVSGTAGASLGDCISPTGETGPTFTTSVICNIDNISQTGVVIVKAKNMINGAVGQNSQKYFIETNAPIISIFPSKKASNQAITGTVEILDDVAISANNVSLTTDPANQLSDRNCVQTDGKRVDCSWTLSGSMLSGASLTVSARDKAGNLSTKTETGFIIDTIPPVVTLDSTGVVNSQNQGSYSLSGTCSIDDGDVSMIIVVNGYKFSSSCTASGTWDLVLDLSIPTMFPDGNIPLKISQTDALGNSTTITGSLLKNTKGPDLTVSLSDGAYLNQQLNTILGTSESGAVITISMLSGTQILTGEVDVNGDWSINITPAFDEGTYEIIVSAEDEHGNKSIDYDINFTIDMTKPVLTLSGSATVNLFVGDVFADEGAIRTDAVDGTGIVYSLNVVDSSQEGTYELEYDYTDQAGNSALTIKRTVIVQAPPVNTGGYYGGGGRYIHNLNEQGDSSSEIIDDEDIVSDPELINAYQWAYEHGITTLSPISRARLYDPITRSELAKMMSVYFMKYGNREQLKGKEGCDGYTDIDMINAELRGYIKTACELEIMGLQSDGKTPLQEFRPNDYVSRAEFSTVFSRMLEGNKYDNNKDDARWEDHLNYLHDRLIITKPDPTITELRAWILLMLYRS
ncbi:MAG TPA: BspA family leucine-rich repeat surface protein [Candidatus Absconditabacterales bacterium]|nr:BspA family leucine-rich repeat surface protein [Candidatus Absconditabacterales bacterium]